VSACCVCRLLLNGRAGEAPGARVDADQTRNVDVLSRFHRLAVERRTGSAGRVDDLPDARKLPHSVVGVHDVQRRVIGWFGLRIEREFA
jgi:hypothetical protein